MRFSCSFKYGTSCHFESSHKNKILCMYISYALLKSVFPKIRVRTWVQVASDWLTYLVYQLEAWFFWQESTWTHVLTLISEKTEFSIYFPSQKPNTRLIHKFVVNFFYTMRILGVVIFRTYLMTHFNRLLDCVCIIVIIYFWIERWRACSHHFWAT